MPLPENDRGKHYYSKEFSAEVFSIPSEKLNKIYCGRSEEVLKNFPNNSIDIILTSPPYNFGMGYDCVGDALAWTDYFESLWKVFDECIRVLKYGGRFIINVQPASSDYIPTHHIISNYLMDKGLIWRCEILWEKNTCNKLTAWGSWKSPSSPYLKCTWEFLEVFCKGDIKKDGDNQEGEMSGEEFVSWVSGKWSIAPERNMQKYDHPAMFPEELVARALKLFSFKDDIVLDPYNGVGTTTFVASRLGRKYIGVDLSEGYCKKAEERVSQNDLFI